MAKGKKKKRKAMARSRDEVLAGNPLDEQRVAAHRRLMEAEQRLYWLWEQRSGGVTDWVGELIGSAVEEETSLWLAALGDKVAALGGHLELRAVLPDESVLLLREPGLTTTETGEEDG